MKSLAWPVCIAHSKPVGVFPPDSSSFLSLVSHAHTHAEAAYLVLNVHAGTDQSHSGVEFSADAQGHSPLGLSKGWRVPEAPLQWVLLVISAPPRTKAEATLESASDLSVATVPGSGFALPPF